MFVADRLVFTELHKTGGTHVCKWLSRLAGGKQIGKHNRVPPELWDRFLIGSVRNPWEWYVSLWAFGCAGKGSVFQQTTHRFDLRYLNRQLHGEMGFRRLPPAVFGRQLLQDFIKPVRTWQACYRDFGDVIAFRNWLKLIFDDKRRFDVGEGFGFSPVAQRHGLMTYRYLKLFTNLGPLLYKDTSLAQQSGVREALESKRLVGFVIRNEHLETDLLHALSLAGYDLSTELKAQFITESKNKTNSSRHLTAEHYYDPVTIELVASRESVIIDTHGYTPPGQ